jgi:hypothetical protein
MRPPKETVRSRSTKSLRICQRPLATCWAAHSVKTTPLLALMKFAMACCPSGGMSVTAAFWPGLTVGPPESTTTAPKFEGLGTPL